MNYKDATSRGVCPMAFHNGIATRCQGLSCMAFRVVRDIDICPGASTQRPDGDGWEHDDFHFRWTRPLPRDEWEVECGMVPPRND